MQYLINLIFPLVFIAFIYKAYLECKIEDPTKEVSILSILAFRSYGMMTFLPVSTKGKNEQERKWRN
jgi:hypothetical protein